MEDGEENNVCGIGCSCDETEVGFGPANNLYCSLTSVSSGGSVSSKRLV